MKTLLFLGAIISLAIAANALSGWLQFKNGTTYYIETALKYNWYQAIHACASKNLSLVAIETDAKNAELTKLLHSFYSKAMLKRRRLWIAGHDNAVAGQYVWITSGHAFSYTNWADAEPNDENDREHCVEIRPIDLRWNDVPCTISMGFICEGNQSNINEQLRAEVTTEAPVVKNVLRRQFFRIG